MAIIGPVQMWVDRLLELASEHRVDTFVLWPRGDEDEQLRRFTLEVAPTVREAAYRR